MEDPGPGQPQAPTPPSQRPNWRFSGRRGTPVHLRERQPGTLPPEIRRTVSQLAREQAGEATPPPATATTASPAARPAQARATALDLGGARTAPPVAGAPTPTERRSGRDGSEPVVTTTPVEAVPPAPTAPARTTETEKRRLFAPDREVDAARERVSIEPVPAPSEPAPPGGLEAMPADAAADAPMAASWTDASGEPPWARTEAAGPTPAAASAAAPPQEHAEASTEPAPQVAETAKPAPEPAELPKPAPAAVNAAELASGQPTAARAAAAPGAADDTPTDAGNDAPRQEPASADASPQQHVPEPSSIDQVDLGATPADTARRFPEPAQGRESAREAAWELGRLPILVQQRATAEGPEAAHDADLLPVEWEPVVATAGSGGDFPKRAADRAMARLDEPLYAPDTMRPTRADAHEPLRLRPDAHDQTVVRRRIAARRAKLDRLVAELAHMTERPPAP